VENKSPLDFINDSVILLYEKRKELSQSLSLYFIQKAIILGIALFSSLFIFFGYEKMMSYIGIVSNIGIKNIKYFSDMNSYFLITSIANSNSFISDVFTFLTKTSSIENVNSIGIKSTFILICIGTLASFIIGCFFEGVNIRILQSPGEEEENEIKSSLSFAYKRKFRIVFLNIILELPLWILVGGFNIIGALRTFDSSVITLINFKTITFIFSYIFILYGSMVKFVKVNLITRDLKISEALKETKTLFVTIGKLDLLKHALVILVINIIIATIADAILKVIVLGFMVIMIKTMIIITLASAYIYTIIKYYRKRSFLYKVI
jgi:hypothetical protein